MDYKTNKLSIPMVALRGLWLYPHMVMHFDVGRTKSVKAVEAAMDQDSRIFLLSQKSMSVDKPKQEDLYDVGVVARIKQKIKIPNGAVRVLVEGVSRASLNDLIDGPYLKANISEYIYNYQDLELDKNIMAAMRMVKEDVFEYEKFNNSSNTEIIMGLDDMEDPSKLADTIASYIQFDLKDQMEILSELDPYKRLIKLHQILVREIEFAKIQLNIDSKVKDNMDESQKEYYLREQINVIRDELGDNLDFDDFYDDYRKELEERDLDDYVIEAAEKELDKLATLNPNSPEVNISRTYLEYLLDIPWEVEKNSLIDIKNTKKVLDEDHYGMEDVKDRILEYVAILGKTGKASSQIICFVGPPGVGKTSISRSIADALDRDFVSMRLGGVRDEAEIRGHRRTYVGAMPGKIVKLIIDAGSMNPVFLLDELDKVSQNYSGDPSSALLEVLDPEQNDEFRDHYLDLPMDLSNVMFIATANSLNTIPSALLDRMEVIRLEGYTYEEKFNIAKKHLIPKVFEKHGIEKSELSISDTAIKSLIDNYTRESGVRELERMISRLARRAVREMVEDDIDKISISIRNLTDYAGQAKYLDDDIIKEAKVGNVTGLAWTQVGGVLLNIEANVMPGRGKLQLTGQLGDVMKESANAALSFIRSNHKDFVLEEDFYKDIDIHIHVPEGATPKDGPSAGISMGLAMLSALTGKKARNDIAMTGEITITGKVLAIGGVKEKLLAAKRHGIKNIILPSKNLKDIKEMKESELEDMNISYVDNFKEVVDLVIIDED